MALLSDRFKDSELEEFLKASAEYIKVLSELHQTISETGRSITPLDMEPTLKMEVWYFSLREHILKQ